MAGIVEECRGAGVISKVIFENCYLTEEEKAEQKALALKRYQEEELRKLQVRHSKPRASMPKETIQPQPSLFDF